MSFHFRTGLLASLYMVLAGVATVAAPLPPSADPVNRFIVVADSVSRAGDDALSAFVRDNAALAGAAVATLLDVAFQVEAQDANAAKENVAFARRVAAIHEAAGGPAAARELVDRYEKWTPAQRKSRARAMELEAKAAESRKAGDIAGALSLLAEARALYEKINDRHAIAVNWGTTGLTRWTTGEWALIAADYEKALATRRAVDDRILEGRTLNGLGSTFQQMGDHAKAIDYYRQAVDLRRKTGDLAGLGTSITYLGHAYNTGGRYVDARRQYEEALPILESLGNPRQMVELLSGIALLNQTMGRVEDADTAYLRAIALASANGLGDAEAVCRRNLANSYQERGRYVEALDQSEQALALLASNPDPKEEARAYLTRGITYMGMGELDDARTDLLHCTQLADSLGDPEFAMLAQINIGHLYRELGAYDRGLKAAERTRQIAEQAGHARFYRDALALAGDFQMRLGRHDDALASWKEALAQDENDQAAAEVVTDQIAIASIHAVTGRGADARALVRAYLPRARALGREDLVWAGNLAIGHTFEQENADSTAFYYERALSGIETAGNTGDAGVETGYLSGQRRYYYEEVTRFYAQRHAATGEASWSSLAFHTIERAKARGLASLLQEGVSEQTSPGEAKVLDALYSLDPKEPGYADRRASLEKEYGDLRRARVEAAMGSLARGPAIAGLDEVARELPKKTVLLEYALGDSASFLWIVERDRRELVELPARAEIDAEVRRMRDAIGRLDTGDAALRASSRKLYRMLLEPADARIAKAGSAIIVPDGVLFELPFEALLSADPLEGAAWSAQPFFARMASTLYAPSATVYASLKSRARSGDYDLDLFAVGNPDFTSLDTRGAAPLLPLPFADAEVAAIGARVKDSKKRIVTGAAASEAAVKQELRTAAHRVVHLATHGLVDPGEPGRSSIALSAGDNEDGYFHTLEILGTPTRAGLVVMSACESARGKISRGEGVVGLGRAFLAAGAGSVAASLWAVSDESTSELMKTFYEQMLGKKKPASRALNEARLALIGSGKFSHPFFWSPFIVTGTERSPW